MPEITAAQMIAQGQAAASAARDVAAGRTTPSQQTTNAMNNAINLGVPLSPINVSNPVNPVKSIKFYGGGSSGSGSSRSSSVQPQSQSVPDTALPPIPAVDKPVVTASQIVNTTPTKPTPMAGTTGGVAFDRSRYGFSAARQSEENYLINNPQALEEYAQRNQSAPISIRYNQMKKAQEDAANLAAEKQLKQQAFKAKGELNSAMMPDKPTPEQLGLYNAPTVGSILGGNQLDIKRSNVTPTFTQPQTEAPFMGDIFTTTSDATLSKFKVGTRKAPIEAILPTDFFSKTTLTDVTTNETFIASKSSPDIFFSETSGKPITIVDNQATQLTKEQAKSFSGILGSETQTSSFIVGSSLFSGRPALALDSSLRKVNPLDAEIGLYRTLNPITRSKPKVKAFTEMTVLGDNSFQVTGKGTVSYTEQTALDRFLKIKPQTKSFGIEFGQNVLETKSFPKNPYLFRDTGFQNLSVGQELALAREGGLKYKVPSFLKGSPNTLEGLVPDVRLDALLEKKASVASGLRGSTSFESQGFVDIYSKGKRIDRLLVGDIQTVVGKKTPSVRVAPLGIDSDFSVFSSKVKSFGEQTTRGRVKGILYSDTFGKYEQVFDNGSINISGSIAKGTGKDIFGLEKVKAYSTRGNKSFKALFDQPTNSIVNDSVASTQTVTTTTNLIPKTKFVPLNTSKLYNDVYGLTVSTRTIPSKELFYATARQPLFEQQPEYAPRFASSSQRNDFKGLELQLNKIQPVTNITQKNVFATKEKQVNLFKQRNDFVNKFSVSEKTIQSPRAIESTRVIERLGEATRQREDTKQKTALKQAFRFNNYRPTVTNFQIKLPPIIPPTDKKNKPFAGGNKLLSGFIPFARVKGKIVALSKVALPFNRATARGAFFTKETTARSFGLFKAGNTTQADIAPINLKQFRMKSGKSRIKENIFIERSIYAIDTGGEKGGLKAAKKTRGLLKRFGF